MDILIPIAALKAPDFFQLHLYRVPGILRPSGKCPFVWLDAIHYKVKEDGAIKTKAEYCLLGVNREGIKDLFISNIRAV